MALSASCLLKDSVLSYVEKKKKRKVEEIGIGMAAIIPDENMQNKYGVRR